MPLNRKSTLISWSVIASPGIETPVPGVDPDLFKLDRGGLGEIPILKFFAIKVRKKKH